MFLQELCKGVYINPACINLIVIEFDILNNPKKITISYAGDYEYEFTDAEATKCFRNLKGNMIA